MNEIKLALPGNIRLVNVAGFEGLRLEDLELPEGVSYDLAAQTHNIVPYAYREGEAIWRDINAENGGDKHVTVTYIFQVGGTEDETYDRYGRMLDVLKSQVFDHLDRTKYHVALRRLYSDNPEYKPRSVPRVFVYRIYRNEDFNCKGHPEMLSGEPMGMHRCGFCMQMQVAGHPHLSEV